MFVPISVRKILLPKLFCPYNPLNPYIDGKQDSITMTHYSRMNKYPTKKSLKEAIKEDPSKVDLYDPSIFNPLHGLVTQILDKRPYINVTNHPKRSWFATIKRNKKGVIVAS